jgi:lysophospholipase L1-like esterase
MMGLRHCIAGAALGCLLGLGWGMAAMHFHIFPHAQLAAAGRLLGMGAPATPSPKPRNSVFVAIAPQSDIVMVGDSLIEQGPWSEIFRNVTIANRGIGGDSTHDVLARMDAIYAVHARKAFVMIGSNDMLLGRPVEAAFEDYKNIVGLLAAHGSQVVIQSTFECSRRTCHEALPRIRRLNARLVEFARQGGYLYLDVNQGVTNDDGLLPQYTLPDGLHLSGQGYLHWSNVVAPHMKI